jgi:hypothetical protein
MRHARRALDLLHALSVPRDRSQSIRTRLPGCATFWRWLAVLPALFCVSCSGNNGLNPVQGTVLYKGEPRKGVLVSFHPEVEDINFVRPTGLTKEDGTFTLTTGDEPGAPAGKYILTFICSEEVERPKGKAMTMVMGPEYEDSFKGAYAEKSASKFHIEVKAGPNQLEPFKLE